jgi:hypothetical protein
VEGFRGSGVRRIRQAPGSAFISYASLFLPHAEARGSFDRGSGQVEGPSPAEVYHGSVVGEGLKGRRPRPLVGRVGDILSRPGAWNNYFSHSATVFGSKSGGLFLPFAQFSGYIIFRYDLRIPVSGIVS